MDRWLGSMGGRLRDWFTGAAALLVLACLLSGWAATSARALGEVSFDQCFGASTGCTALTGNPLAKAVSVAVSPNGQSVYVGGQNLTHFFVGPSGSLTYDGCINDGSIAGCQTVPGDGSQFNFPVRVAVSPNSDSVYTADEGGSVAHLFADPQGRLSWDGCVSDDGSGGLCADVPGTGDPLALPVAVAVSPNGGSVYTLAVTDTAGGATLSHLFANPSQGQLTWDGCVSNDGSGGACLDIPGGGSPLSGFGSVAVSPNGASVYVTGSGDVSHAFVNPSGGQLSWDGCVSDDGSGGTCADVPGTGSPLSDAEGIAVAPNGTDVYVVSSDGTVSHLTANPSGGQLTWDGCVSDDGSGGTCADLPGSGQMLNGAFGVAISPDGRSLYVASASASSLVVFDVGPQGELTFDQCLADSVLPDCTNPAGDALSGALGVAVSPDGRSVYVAGEHNGTLVHFLRATSGGLTVHTAKANVGNQRVKLSTQLPSGCLPNTGSLIAKLSSSAIPGSRAKHVRFSRAAISIDHGTEAISHHLPTSVGFKLTGNLGTGTHALRAKAFFHKTVKRLGRRRTLTVSALLQIKFNVC